MKTPYKINTPEDIKACKVDVEEQECSISISRKDSKVSIYVTDNTYLTKIKRVWAKDLNNYTCYAVKNNSGDITGYYFETIKKNISFRNSNGKKNISEEARQKLKERMREGRKKRKISNN